MNETKTFISFSISICLFCSLPDRASCARVRQTWGILADCSEAARYCYPSLQTSLQPAANGPHLISCRICDVFIRYMVASCNCKVTLILTQKTHLLYKRGFFGALCEDFSDLKSPTSNQYI